jgi:hypothetical protein
VTVGHTKISNTKCYFLNLFWYAVNPTHYVCYRGYHRPIYFNYHLGIFILLLDQDSGCTYIYIYIYLLLKKFKSLIIHSLILLENIRLKSAPTCSFIFIFILFDFFSKCDNHSDSHRPVSATSNDHNISIRL